MDSHSADTSVTRVGRKLFVIVLLGALIRVLCSEGFVPSDDSAYAELAYSMGTGGWREVSSDLPPVFPLRVGIIAPVAAGFSTFGVERWVLFAYPFVTSLAEIALAFALACRLFGQRAGLVAAALQATVPIDVQSATRLWPDVPAAAWAGLGILLLHVSSDAPRTTRAAAGISAGLSIAMSWLCKETVLYLAPFLAGFALWRVRSHRGAVLPVILASLLIAAVLAAEAMVYASQTGDPLHRFHAMTRTFDFSREWFFVEGERFGWQAGEYGRAVAARIVQGPFVVLFNPTLAFVPGIAVAALLLARGAGLRGLAVLGAWLLSVALMFAFGSTSFRIYQPLVLLNRYLVPLVLPAVCIIAGIIAHRHQLVARRRPIAIVMLGIVIIANAAGIVHRFVMRSSDQHERKVAQLTTPSETLYTDSRSAASLKFFWKYPIDPALNGFEGLDRKQIADGSLVLLHRKHIDFLRDTYGYRPPSFYTDVPPEWTLAWQSDGVALYRASAPRSRSSGAAANQN